MTFSWKLADDGPLFSLRRSYECAVGRPTDRNIAAFWALLQEDLTVALAVMR